MRKRSHHPNSLNETKWGVNKKKNITPSKESS